MAPAEDVADEESVVRRREGPSDVDRIREVDRTHEIDSTRDVEHARDGASRATRDGRLGSAARDRVTAAVCAIAALALAVRVVGIGGRPFHWGEARVGYWALRFAQSGTFTYRPVAGGPFLYVVDGRLFSVLPPTDAVARLVVAVVGGLLPLVALSFRTRLRDDETVVFAAFLALNPLLVYYSRFLRGDVPLAAFALAAVGLTVRAVDTGSRRALYGAGLAFGLALAASGFVVGYLVCWLVAGALVADHAALVATGPSLDDRAAALVRWVRGRATPMARATLLAVGTVLFFYAPRAGAAGGPGLWKPLTWPAVFESALVGSAWKFYGVRVLARPNGGTHPILPYVRGSLGTLALAALPLVALAVVAFLADRYRSGGPRPVVAFSAYWGGAALFVFPLIAEVNAPWVAVHAAVPLALPAAVGGARLLRAGANAFDRGDAATVAAAALIVLAVLAQVGAVTARDVYGPSDRDNRLAQFAQPGDDLAPLLAKLRPIVRRNDGVDVLYYGERFYTVDDRANDRPPVGDAWGHRLPLPWYFERMGARTASVKDEAQFSGLGTVPPVVVADASDRGKLAPQLDGYAASEYHLGLWDRRVVVFVKQ
ncbi:MAG: flippase activity-associated protein Agl23 [Salinigranum sp.]